jgi:probable rRNA maturation factor
VGASGVNAVVEPPVEIEEALVAATCSVVTRALDSLGAADCEMTIVLTGDGALADLNARYRGIDAPTDVLSFPAAEGASEPGAARYLGDVIISVERARAQAIDGDVAGELALLAVHGLLHLLGHEDDTDKGRSLMEDEERGLGVR